MFSFGIAGNRIGSLVAVTAFSVALIVIMQITGSSVYAETEYTVQHHSEDYFRLLDEGERLLWETGRELKEGEKLLTGDNRLYEIYEVDEKQRLAHSRLIEEEVGLPDPDFDTLLREYAGQVPYEAQDQRERSPVAIYHTHNAESYVPTDGTHSIDGRGGIHEVGRTFKESLQEREFDVIFSEEMHLPHDRGAYRRSRETKLELLGADPLTVYDVHRDAAPAEQYREQLNTQTLAQIMLVIGMQNPNYEANRKYALSLKSVADEIHPNLIRGIFFSQADFNQDLFPLSVLLEVGGHLNTREEAERGIALFADVVEAYFFGPEAAKRRAEEEGVGWRTALELLLLGLVVGSAFFILQAGSLAAFRERLGDLWARLREVLKI